VKAARARCPRWWPDWWPLVLVISLLAFPLAVSFAQTTPQAQTTSQRSDPAPSAMPSATAAGGSAPAPPVPRADTASEEHILHLWVERAALIRDLLDGTLAPTVEATSLFDIDIHDPTVVAVEARRLGAVVERARLDEAHVAEKADAGPLPDPTAKVADLVADATTPEHATERDDETTQRTDPATWRARLALDQARLAFYRLEPAARAALLSNHAEARRARAVDAALEADAARTADEAIEEVEREAARAEADKQAALDAAEAAHSEVQRAIHEERARLLGIVTLQAEQEKKLIRAREAMEARHDLALGKLREVNAVVERRRREEASAVVADAAYLALREDLREARDALSAALDDLNTQPSAVLGPGEDTLAALPADVDRTAVDTSRAAIDERRKELALSDRALREEQARLLLAEVESLNRARLDLLPLLSAAKADDITGFSAAGLDQARSEARHVWLVLRYHVDATRLWLSSSSESVGRGQLAWTLARVALPWLIPLALFVWWRRRAARLLSAWRAALREAHDKREGRTVSPAASVRALGFLMRVRGPLEWMLLLWTGIYLLPTSVGGLLEVELLVTIASWALGGALVVDVIDAISSEDLRGGRRVSRSQKTPRLRLRSLRLIGRVVVAVGLLLAISAKLVGKGTIYSWVLSVSWLAALPVLLVIVTWWRTTIFERLALVRGHNRFVRWMLERKNVVSRFAAAGLGGAYLFAEGGYRALRGWAVRFTWVRRLLAYLFRRDMSHQASKVDAVEYAPISDEAFSLLGPESPSDELVPSAADEQLAEVIARIEAEGGGVFAIVGERGAGKTTLMKRIGDTSEDLTHLACPVGGLDAFKRALNVALSLDEHATFDVVAHHLDARRPDSALLIDDAQRLILPMMGGLRDFDQVLELARRSSENCTWVFAIDHTLWRFLERARGARPLFDDVIQLLPWAEEAIVDLINLRNDRAAIDPGFEHLVTDLPGDADELDILDALQRTEGSYYRLLWDYASGNPAVALHFWRKSLGLDAEGKVSVRVFEAPDPESLEDLPDATVFVLKAAVQLGSTDLSTLRAATALPASEVKDALRYGMVKGYFERDANGYAVTWDWFRAITRFLRRRHLLFSQ